MLIWMFVLISKSNHVNLVDNFEKNGKQENR
jgi:hypothetical protein